MQVESTKDEVATFKSTKADLERQLDVVNEEFTLAKTQMDAKWTLFQEALEQHDAVSCLLYTSPSPRDRQKSRMPSSA